MKKFMSTTFLLLMSLAMMAQGTEKIDATRVKQITFQGDQLTIVFADGTTQSFDDLSTVTIDFSATTAIEERLAIAEREGLEGKAVYDLKGQRVGNSVARLAKGVYIVGGKKVVVKN